MCMLPAKTSTLAAKPAQGAALDRLVTGGIKDKRK
jgi:hypothetical protein